MMAREGDPNTTTWQPGHDVGGDRPLGCDVHESLRRFMELGNEAALTVDAGGTIHASCRSTTNLLACSGERLIGQRLDDLFMEADVDLASPVTFVDMIDTPIRATGRRADGRTVAVNLEIRPLDDDAGDRFLVLIRPLSSLRRFDFELERLIEHAPAHQSADPRDNIGACVAQVSHEIRTPMTAMLGYADLLTDRTIDEADRDTCVDMIRSNGRYLLTLINDLLDLSKMQAGKLAINDAPCDPTEITRDVAAFLSVQARSAGLAFDVQFGDGIPSTIVTDPIRLRQILINLVGNAIKFTQAGGVQLSCHTTGGNGDESARLVFDVMDTGPGLTERQIERIFDPFDQAGVNHHHHASTGTGLGLTICRKLTSLLGARIDVSSEPGQGSTFSLSFDLSGVADKACSRDNPCIVPKPAQFGPGAPGRILIAEDAPDTRRLVRTVLEQQGFHVVTAEDGQRSVDRAIEAHRAGGPFDLILMDMQMPVMDGYTAASTLRQAGYTAPIVALTASVLGEEHARAIEAGCDHCLTKPIERNQFLAAVRRLIASPMGLSA